MTKAILLSIHPKWTKLIYEGKKTIEWRKNLTKNDSSVVFIYETSPVKKVTGAFSINGAIEVDFSDSDFDLFKWQDGCVPLDELKKYQGKSKSLYGWLIAVPKRFKIPKTLADFGLKRAPQSWQYVEVNNG